MNMVQPLGSYPFACVPSEILRKSPFRLRPLQGRGILVQSSRTYMYNEIRARSYLFDSPAQYFRAILGGVAVLNIRCRMSYKCIIVMHW